MTLTGASITKFDDRWAWITVDALPIWQALTTAQRSALVSQGL